MTYDTFDVVVVPLPFTDRSSNKRRPALVVSRHESFSAIIEHSVKKAGIVVTWRRRLLVQEAIDVVWAWLVRGAVGAGRLN